MLRTKKQKTTTSELFYGSRAWNTHPPPLAKIPASAHEGLGVRLHFDKCEPAIPQVQVQSYSIGNEHGDKNLRLILTF